VRSVLFGDVAEEGDDPEFVNDDYGAQVRVLDHITPQMR
jgi:hypothetical protein